MPVFSQKQSTLTHSTVFANKKTASGAGVRVQVYDEGAV